MAGFPKQGERGSNDVVYSSISEQHACKLTIQSTKANILNPAYDNYVKTCPLLQYTVPLVTVINIM